MKRILFLFISIYCSLLIADSYLHTNFNTYNQSSSFENYFNWNSSFFNDVNVSFDSKHINSENSFFKRSSKTSSYSYRIKHDKYAIKPFLMYDYLSLYNTGLPEDSISINDKRINKIGLGFNTKWLDNKLHIHQKSQYIKLSSPLNNYYGWSSENQLSHNLEFLNNSINTSVYYFNNDIFLDRYFSRGFDITYRYNSYNSMLFKLKHDYIEKETYSYNLNNDTSKRMDYFAEIRNHYYVTDNFDWIIVNRTNYRKLNFTYNKNRDNWLYDNDFLYQFNIRSYLGVYYASFNMINKKRYLKSNDQFRDSDERKLLLGTLWNLNFVDTLRVEIMSPINQNYHSDSYRFLDNDRVINSYLISLVNNFKNHKINNTLQFFNGEQVYIDRILSANNHKKLSYLWSPETQVKIFNNIYLINKYQVRADYEYFIWNEFLKDRFYRSLNAEWGVRVFSKSYNMWYYDFFSTYFAFILDHTEAAENEDGNWYRNNNEYQRKYLMSVNYQKKNFIISFQPLIKYYNHSFESEFQADTTFKIGNDLAISSSLNPIGRQFNKMIWRFSANVTYSF